MHIAIIYSVPVEEYQSGEIEITDEDTKASALKVQKALLTKSVSVSLHPVNKHTLGSISKIKADCIVDLVEWDGKELETSRQALALMEKLHIPITGATKENYMMVSDKAQMKKQFDLHHIPTARWQVFRTGKESVRNDFNYPVLVKLTLTHCSIGLSHDSIAHNSGDLLRIVKKKLEEFDEPILAEEFVDGREFQITLLERKAGLTVLPPAEVLFKSTGEQAFLTYDSRWVKKTDDYHDSRMEIAKITPGQFAYINTICLHAYKKLGFRDYSRFDTRLKTKDGHDILYFLETNANPGLDDTTNYGIPISYKAVGMSFADFVWEIVENAIKRGAS